MELAVFLDAFRRIAQADEHHSEARENDSTGEESQKHALWKAADVPGDGVE